MNIPKKYFKTALVLFTLATSSIIATSGVFAAGISIDAGLTPAANRWVFRSQMRFMQRDNDPNPVLPEMKSYMFPVVMAYGLRSDLTLMVRQVIRRSEMTMMGNRSTNSGFTDLFIMSKYRLYRINKPSYTLGIAPTLGLEIPSGSKEFTSDSWDLRMGVFMSGRLRSWGADFNTTYNWTGMAKTGDSSLEPGDEFTIEGALAYQLGWGANANLALAPVIEFSYGRISADTRDNSTVVNTGESVFLLSPGIKFTLSSFMVESLVQFPVWQKQNGLQTERGLSFIIGIRLLS